jgi:predicted Holliday junction resolvase-like endonuclease
VRIKFIRRKPRARTKKVNRSKRSKRQTRRRRRRRRRRRQDVSDSENSDVIDDLSGDEVDQSNIIAGGRASRSTRPVFTKQMYAAANLEDESEDEE